MWLPADVAAPLLEADFTHTALYHELAARTGIRLEGGREHIRAAVPTRSMAAKGHAGRLACLPRDQ